jgi:putative Ca2+/H+ antiporter (TMEM165/GDT1 family)
VEATGASFAAAFVLAFWAVLIAELVGDKSIYALASLALRFRWAVVFISFSLASAAKMMVAALLGSAIIRFQSHWTYLISGIAFFVSAILIWVEEPPKPGPEPTKKKTGWFRGAIVCFGSFFLAEWGDPGQIAVAALVLKSHLLLATWVGATLALMVKGGAALALGLQIRNRLPLRTLRIVSSGSCCILGLLAIGESLLM